MAEFTAEQVEDMVRTMELAPEQRSLGQITRLMDSVAGCKFFQNLPFKQQQLVCRYLRPRQLADRPCAGCGRHCWRRRGCLPPHLLLLQQTMRRRKTRLTA